MEQETAGLQQGDSRTWKHVLYAAITVALAYLATGTVDHEVAQLQAEEPPAPPGPVEIRRPHFLPMNDPVRPPRCPKGNAEKIPLREEIAMQADGGEWSHSCYYAIEV